MTSPEIIKNHLAKDKKLAPLIAQFDFPVFDPNREVFTSLMSSIISQQLSVKAAATIHGRFLNLFHDQEIDAEEVLNLSIEELRAVGLSRQKSTYVQNVAEYFLSEKLIDFDWSAWSDEEVIKKLSSIKGVGKWTVEMVLMFTLNRPDILPVDDLGIQQAMEKLCGIDLSQKKKEIHQAMFAAAKPWEPYRTYASLYLWQYKDMPTP